MIRRLFRIGLVLGAVGGVAYALTKFRAARSPGATPSATATPEPWVEATDGVCPVSHPVKAKLASKIFHLPGMVHYERLRPDRCYANAAEAEADGFRAAKR